MTHSEAREGVASPRQGEVVCRECHGPVSLCRCGYESPAPSPASPTEERRVLAAWKPVTSLEPAPWQVVLCYRMDDLYPVVAWRQDPQSEGRNGEEAPWMLEEGGAEDRSDREYPAAGGAGNGWTPEFWMPLPDLPEEHFESRRDRRRAAVVAVPPGEE